MSDATEVLRHITGKKTVKGGCWDIPRLDVGCYDFMLLNVSSLPLMFYVVGFLGLYCPELALFDVWIEWGSQNCFTS